MIGCQHEVSNQHRCVTPLCRQISIEQKKIALRKILKALLQIFERINKKNRNLYFKLELHFQLPKKVK